MQRFLENLPNEERFYESAIDAIAYSYHILFLKDEDLVRPKKKARVISIP